MNDSLIRKADDALYHHFHRFRLQDYLNPINRFEEKEAFLKAWKNGEHYQPVFEYVPLPEKYETALLELEKLDLGESPLAAVYESTLFQYADDIRLIKARGKEDFTGIILEKYGLPDRDLLADAAKMLKKDTSSSKNMEVGVKALAENLRDKLREERVEGWEMAEDPQCVDVYEVDPAYHKIRLQSGMIVSKKNMKRLRFRLVQVHLYRALNGGRQPYKLFGMGLHQSWTTEEALAMYLEQKEGLLDVEMQRFYLGKLLATSLAIHHSFYGVFSRLETHFDLDTAYTLTESVKRGLVEAAGTGGFVRDHACFLQQKKISQLGTDDLNWLYTGRISVHHLNLVKDMVSQNELLQAAFLPK